MNKKKAAQPQLRDLSKPGKQYPGVHYKIVDWAEHAFEEGMLCVRVRFADKTELCCYVSLQHRSNAYLMHESLSSMTEKLKPYGFIRIHRSVVMNISAVEEIQPLATGEYRLRVKGGKQYMVTRTYKRNLRDMAQLWVGS